ncbi:MAG: DNRLRE domain-containing protein [Phycisphaerae bacterium]|nr:DNRLRE domain-containing protein [Tepidisphaeraceae bacterium]
MRIAMFTAGAVLCCATGVPAAVITLTPVADTYVSSANPTTAQGSMATVVANNGSTTTNYRWVYLRFDVGAALAANAATFADVTGIKLTLQSVTAGALVESVYGLPAANDSWTEAALTMSNDPNKDTTVASKPVFDVTKAYSNGTTNVLATWTSRATAGSEDAFNVASGPVFDYIGADADKVLTFVIAADRNTGAGGVAWASREATSSATWPTLTLLTTPAPEPGTIGLLGTAAAGLLVRRRRTVAARA